MTWHTAIVPAGELIALLARIHSLGGIIARCRPGTDGVRVTWTTASADGDLDIACGAGSQ